MLLTSFFELFVGSLDIEGMLRTVIAQYWLLKFKKIYLLQRLLYGGFLVGLKQCLK